MLLLVRVPMRVRITDLVFFFNDPATPEIYTLSLHDALPILVRRSVEPAAEPVRLHQDGAPEDRQDRKSTRLNSSHVEISYAVFCLKKKRNSNLVGTTQIRVLLALLPTCRSFLRHDPGALTDA